MTFNRTEFWGSDDTTIPSEASDPYTITSEELSGDNTDLPSIMTCPNPSYKTPSPYPQGTDLNNTPIMGPTNSKETLQTSQHGVLGRPNPKPPDKS